MTFLYQEPKEIMLMPTTAFRKWSSTILIWPKWSIPPNHFRPIQLSFMELPPTYSPHIQYAISSNNSIRWYNARAIWIFKSSCGWFPMFAKLALFPFSYVKVLRVTGTMVHFGFLPSAHTTFPTNRLSKIETKHNHCTNLSTSHTTSLRIIGSKCSTSLSNQPSCIHSLLFSFRNPPKVKLQCFSSTTTSHLYNVLSSFTIATRHLNTESIGPFIHNCLHLYKQ